MRIEKTRSTSAGAGTKKSSGAGDASAFSSALSSAASSVSVSATSGTSSLSSVAALMALQVVDDPLERRRRVERRGRQMLDGLDALKLDMLEGRDPTATLQRLKSALETAREESADSQLESLIDQIELRAEVELAKLSMRRSR